MLRPEADKSERYLLVYRDLAILGYYVGVDVLFERERMVRRVVTLINRGNVGAAIDYLSERLRFQGDPSIEVARKMCDTLPCLYGWIAETSSAPEY